MGKKSRWSMNGLIHSHSLEGGSSNRKARLPRVRRGGGHVDAWPSGYIGHRGGIIDIVRGEAMANLELPVKTSNMHSTSHYLTPGLPTDTRGTNTVSSR